MSRQTLTFAVADIIRSLTPVVIKNSSSSSTQAIAQRLHPDNFAQTINDLVEIARSSFRSDEFAADLAQLNVLSSLRRQLVAVYSASFGDEDVAAILVEAFNSTKRLAEIQGDERFSADIKPLHDRMKEEGLAVVKVRDRLRARLEPRVVPLAPASDWATTIGRLADAGRGKTKKERVTALTTLLASVGLRFEERADFELDGMLSAFAKFSADDIATAAASFDISSEAPSSDENEILSRAGHLSVAIMWQQFINCITRGTSSASGLVDHRRSTELAASRVALLDFGLGLEGIDKVRGSYAMRTQGSNGASRSTLWTAEEQVGAKEVGPTALTVSAHSRALIFHVLAYAGVTLIELDEAGKPAAAKSGPTAALVTCGSAVPLAWHSLAPLFDHRLKDLYKAFTPGDIEFTSISYLLELVSKRRQGLLSIAIERPKLERMMLDDIRLVIKGVRESSQEGADDRIADIVQKAASRLYSYEVRCLTPFAEGLSTVETNVSQFVTGGDISLTSTRAIGTFEIPRRYGRGFDEVVLRSDRHSFDAIVDSAPITDIATAYNAVVRLDEMTTSSVGLIAKVNSWMSDALFDLSRAAVRENRAALKPTLMASELFGSAAFAPMSDYTILRMAEDEISVPLEAGIDKVQGHIESWGNIHGSITWGALRGRHDSLSTAYDRGLAASVVETISQVVESYVPRVVPVEVTDGKGIEISLNAENRSYSSRLRHIDSSFSALQVDQNLILQLAASATTDPAINKMVDGSLLRALKRSDLQVMSTAEPVMNFIADFAAEQLIASYSKPAVQLMIASLTRPLTEAEHMTLRTPVFRASVKNMTSYLASTVTGVTPLFGSVMLSIIMKTLAEKAKA